MIKTYLKDTSGQFALMVSLISTGLLMGGAAAVDLTGSVKMKTELQNYSDMAVIAAATSRSENLDVLQKLADESIRSNNQLGLEIDPIVSVNNGIVQVKLSTEYKTKMMGMFGRSVVDINVVSESPIATETAINMVLVLDQTGSMSGENMSSLKKASSKLVTVLEKMDTDIKVSVVPFSNYVNVGLENATSVWMDIPPEKEVCWQQRDLVNPSLCTQEPRTGSNDGQPVDYTATTCPANAYGQPYKKCAVQKWHGCAGSRPGSWHEIPGYKHRPIPGINDVSCGNPVLPLTSNLRQVDSYIQSMSAAGNTYIPAGLIWGWRMLDAELPYNDLSNSDKKRIKAMVVMTDGANTLSLTQPSHTGSDAAEADKLSETLCKGIKASDIHIYTVAYRLPDATSTKDIIRKCATDSSSFFSPENAEELADAFENIARSMYAVRLSR